MVQLFIIENDLSPDRLKGLSYDAPEPGTGIIKYSPKCKNDSSYESPYNGNKPVDNENSGIHELPDAENEPVGYENASSQDPPNTENEPVDNQQAAQGQNVNSQQTC